MKALSDTLIGAFRGEHKDRVLSFVSEEYRTALSRDLTVSTARLTAFAAAFANSGPVAADDLIAEYAMTSGSAWFSSPTRSAAMTFRAR